MDENIYSEEALNEIRAILEAEYRKDYDSACKNSHLEWQRRFKKKFEIIIEALDDFDKLFR